MLEKIFYHVIEKDRLNKVAENGGRVMGVTSQQFIDFMTADFLNAFLSGYYGRKVMIHAAQEYFADIEQELQTA